MTSPVSLPSGSKITAAKLDAYENLTGAWTSYTPAWSASGTPPSLGNGTMLGQYVRAGNFIVAAVRIIMGSTTTFGTGSYSFSVPFATTGSTMGAGPAALVDAGTALRSASASWATTTTVNLFSDTAVVGATSPFTFAVNDQIQLTIVYQGA